MMISNERTQPEHAVTDGTGMKTPTSVLLAGLLALAATSGCYVLPPVRAGAGVGGSAGAVVIRDSPSSTRSHGAAGIGQIRAAFTPLALDAALSRPIDVGVGWTLDWSAASSARGFRHGPFLETAWFVRRGATESRTQWRWGPTVLAELHLADKRSDDADIGFGVAGGVLLEYVESVHGPVFLGRAAGDLGLGVAARVGARHEDGGSHGYAVVSLEFRWPGMAGASIPFSKDFSRGL